MKLKASLSRLTTFSKRHQQYLVAALLAFSTSLVMVGLRTAGAFQQSELRTFDQLLRLRPDEKPDPRIVIVEISESDIQRLAKWPWTDQMFADLVTKISAGKPAVIGIDKFLDIPVGEGRANLLKALQQAGNGINITFLPLEGKGVDMPDDLASVSDYGFVNIITDPGSLVRRSLLVVDYESLAFLVAKNYLERAKVKIAWDAVGQKFLLGGRVIPRIDPDYGGYRGIDARGYQVLLNYRGRPGTFEHISSVDTLRGVVNPNIFRDRIVLIGVTAVSLKDNYPTPFSTAEEGTGIMYGVEIHANTVSQLLSAALDDRAFIQVWANEWESLWIAVWTLVGGGLAAFLPQVLKNLIALTSLAITLCGLVYLAFLQAWWIPFVPTLAGLLTANILVTALRFSQEQAERRLLMGLFSRHVSKELVDIIWNKREQFLQEGRIAGQEVYVTVMFTDMRSFSSCAEVQQPSETLTWLNEYLGAIASVVLEHGGMVDKYIGDAVMAVFGVPIPHSNETERCRDAQNAVTSALTAAKKLVEMNKTWQAQGLPPVVTGIGINSGIVIAGSLGSSERLEYSVIGDTVNIAARLENLNKEVDGGTYHILISNETHNRLGDKFKVEPVGNFALKGRASETEVFRVLDVKNSEIYSDKDIH